MGCIENAREGRKHLPKSRKVVRDLSVAWWTVTFFERQVALLFLLAGFLSTNVLRLSQTQAGVTILWPAFLQRSRVIMIFACNYTVLPVHALYVICTLPSLYEFYCVWSAYNNVSNFKISWNILYKYQCHFSDCDAWYFNACDSEHLGLLNGGLNTISNGAMMSSVKKMCTEFKGSVIIGTYGHLSES